MINYKWIGLIAMVCIICCQSCKKGCPYPKAYNFQKSAKENDGSCLYCDSLVQLYTTNNSYVYDNNYNSQFYGQNVMLLSVYQNLVNYNGNGCKLLGKTNNNGYCTNFYYSTVLYNQTAKTMTFTGDIQLQPYSSQYLYYHVAQVVIAPYAVDTIYLGSACGQYSGFNLQVTNYSFVYQ